MKTASLETTDIFRGAFYLCMGGDLNEIRFKANGSQIATFHFKGQALHKHDKAYINGHALVNPVQFREALNHLRDLLFKKLREHGQASHGYAVTSQARQKRYTLAGRYENDRKRENRAYQRHG